MLNRIFLNELLLSNITFVHTYIATYDKYPMRNKGRFHNGFLFTLAGTETYCFKDSSIKATPGSVIYIPKGESYKITFDGEESVVVTIDFEIIGEIVRPFKVDFAEINAINSCFQDIVIKWEKRRSNYVPECKSLFYKIVSMLSKQISASKESYENEGWDTAMKFLKENYLKRSFNIDDLSNLAGTSRRYFEILFQRKYNMTPKAYILSLKIERAKELLLSEKVMIKDIALMLGYGDIYHFGKIFKLKTGYTPSEYRRTHGL